MAIVSMLGLVELVAHLNLAESGGHFHPACFYTILRTQLGFRERQRSEIPDTYLFPELAEKESQEFIEGSARIALQIEPEFDKYVFIEQNPKAFSELVRIRDDFPDKASRIDLKNEDANEWLRNACELHRPFWRSNRAVVFLDPFGMQVEWQTIEAIGNTEAIDLWILFPLGVAVNRLLRRDDQIEESWRAKLDSIFGTPEWHDVFYRNYVDLFGEKRSEKIVNLEGIGRYYNDRLKTIFEGVAQNSRPLYNSRGNPLYLLCFAASNPRGARTALKIAQYILTN